MVALLVLVGAVLTVPPTAAAQGVERPLIGIAGGGDIRASSPNIWLAQVSAQWRARASGLGVRAELSYIERGRENQSFYPPDAFYPCPFPGCSGPTVISQRTRGIGASVNGTYEFLHDASVRPYVISGIGLLATRLRLDVTHTPTPCPACAANTAPALGSSKSDEHLAATLNGGAGIVFDLGRAHVFTELRYQLTDARSERTLSPLLPLTLGVGF
jgi:hypothetical protein